MNLFSAKRSAGWVVASLVLCACSARQAKAVEADPAWELSLQGGEAILAQAHYVVNFDQLSSPMIGGSALFSPTRWVSFGLELSWADNFFQHNGSSEQYRKKVLEIAPLVQVGAWLGDSFRYKPYFSFGGGLYREHDRLTFTEPLVPQEIQGWSNHGGINAGLGILFAISRNLAVGPDLRYHRIFESGGDFPFAAAQLRLAWTF